MASSLQVDCSQVSSESSAGKRGKHSGLGTHRGMQRTGVCNEGHSIVNVTQYCQREVCNFTQEAHVFWSWGLPAPPPQKKKKKKERGFSVASVWHGVLRGV